METFSLSLSLASNSKIIPLKRKKQEKGQKAECEEQTQQRTPPVRCTGGQDFPALFCKQG